MTNLNKNNKTDFLNKINEISDLVDFTETPDIHYTIRTQTKYYSCWGSNEGYRYAVSKINSANFWKIFNELYNFNDQIPKVSYEEDFKKKLFDLIYDSKCKKNEIDYNGFIKTLLKTKLNKYTFISNLYGISLIDNTCIEISKNIVIAHSNFVLKEYNHDNWFIDKVRNNKSPFEKDHIYLIYKNIEAIDEKKAKILLEKKFEHFINTFLYCYGSKRDDNQKISLHDISSNEKNLLINQNGETSNSWARKDLINPVYSIPKIFPIDKNYKELFDFLDTDENLTPIERKIKIAVNWIGKSLKNNNIDEAFLYLFLGIESLFSRDDKELISSSIVNHISEIVAFLNSDSPIDRINISQKIKILYGKRSSLVHTGVCNVLEEDYYDLLYFIKTAIEKLFLLKNDKINSIKNSTELQNWHNKIKFSGKL
jgi:hypothetical protein